MTTTTTADAAAAAAAAAAATTTTTSATTTTWTDNKSVGNGSTNLDGHMGYIDPLTNAYFKNNFNNF